MGHAFPVMLNVVVPALNAARTLSATLRALEEGRRSGLVSEILVVDGGSRDETVAVARTGHARVVESGAGRGLQLVTGAAAARSPWLLFLHADTVLGEGWTEVVQNFIETPGSEDRAAVFRFALDDADPRARRIEALARWRGRALALPYGDQGLLISRRLYDALGGFRPLALMEDVDFVRRIGRRGLVELDAAALTSAARYRAGGWWLRPLRNLTILTLYFLGLPPDTLKRLYG
jgi:rSAM/selenodomain-associated transferase 2